MNATQMHTYTCMYTCMHIYYRTQRFMYIYTHAPTHTYKCTHTPTMSLLEFLRPVCSHQLCLLACLPQDCFREYVCESTRTQISVRHVHYSFNLSNFSQQFSGSQMQVSSDATYHAMYRLGMPVDGGT